MTPDPWLIFLAQLPAAPSSARVALWRRLRTSGATGVQNGAWILPKNNEHEALLTQLAETVRSQGGSASLFTSTALTPEEHDNVLARFRADRAREYDEFAERALEFFAEIEKETKRQKFTFAELEEIEEDLDKMASWLDKIKARDFYPDHRMADAVTTLEGCHTALKPFAEAVYLHEGVSAPADDEAERDSQRND